MKKLFAFLVIIVCNTAIYSQTKTETKDWIIETFNSFKRTENKNDFLKIEKDSLIFHSYFYKYTYSKIAFKDIVSIQIRKRSIDGLEWYQIDLNTNKKIEVGKYQNETYSKDYSNGASLSILLNTKFGLDDYPKRMEKALLRIITLHGGKAKILKEAF